MNLDFRLCQDTQYEPALRDVLANCVSFLTARIPNRLVAVILTGSFSRGEGTVLRVGGHLRVLGDMEFLVVLRQEQDYRRVRRQMAAWGPEASVVVGQDAVRVDLEFGPVEVAYLKHRARPSIFVHDLATHGKVLWGPPDLLRAIPAFTAAAIPPEDALYLLFNRTIEQLEAWERLDELEGQALLDLAYHRLKLFLDVAGSALAFEGGHVSSYARRPAAFADLVARDALLASRLPASFQRDLDRAAAAKLAPRIEDLLPPEATSLEAQRAYVRERIVAAVPAVAGLLRWELERLLGMQGAVTDLLRAWLRRQPLGRRVWDWAKVALHPMPAPLPMSGLRSARLFFRSTPRALFYTAGVLAYLSLIDPARAPSTIPALLPVGRAATPRTAAAQRRTIVALWRWCVRNN